MTESLGGMDEAVDAARALAHNGDVFLPDQFSNPANPDVHRRTTGPEILKALDDQLDIFVAGVGTGGTITGAGEAIKARCPGARIVAVEPSASPVISGGSPGPHKIQGIGAGFVPEVLNRELLDEIMPIDDEVAIETARQARSQRRGPHRHVGRGGRRRRARSCRAGRRIAARGSLPSSRTPASGTSQRRSSLPSVPIQKFACSRGAPGGAAQRPRILVHLQCTSDSASLRGIPR